MSQIFEPLSEYTNFSVRGFLVAPAPARTPHIFKFARFLTNVAFTQYLKFKNWRPFQNGGKKNCVFSLLGVSEVSLSFKVKVKCGYGVTVSNPVARKGSHLEAKTQRIQEMWTFLVTGFESCPPKLHFTLCDWIISFKRQNYKMKAESTTSIITSKVRQIISVMKT